MNFEMILETLKRKRVIRKGRPTVKYTTDKKGYKVQYNKKTGQAKEVRMTPQEIRRRMIASRKSKIKRKSKMASINRRRTMSMRKRRTW